MPAVTCEASPDVLHFPTLSLARALCKACGTHFGALMEGVGLSVLCATCLANRAYALDEPVPLTDERRRAA